MPQLTTAVLKDSSNADHTFTPNDIEGGVASLVESTGVPIGDKRITIGRSQTQQGRRKVTLKLTLPVVQNAEVNGVTRPTVTRTAYADVVLTFDGASTSAERLDALAYLKSLSDNDMVEAVVGNLQGLY